MSDQTRAILATANEIRQVAREFGMRLSELADRWESAHHFPLTGPVEATHEEAVAFLEANTRNHTALNHLRSAYANASKAVSSINGEAGS